DIPWHISAFHPDYKFLTHKATIRDILRKARDIAKSYGLNYVYLGNLSQNSDSDTECPNCKRIIVWRKQFQIQNNYIKDGKCKFCSAEVSGVF
ncbi:MAG: radical SAM protein, partial [Candidatus Omnitrophica bacterium]|nr:radical SAM protein [Candidatus Omnitrophota bacterium]